MELRMANIMGDAWDNTLFGTSTADRIDGGLGADAMAGLLGDDIYYVDNVGDLVQERAGEGTDLVHAAISGYVLSANVENLTLDGDLDLNGSGNELDNVITGNTGNNNIYGDEGDDQLIGGAGDDVLIGGAGNDLMTGGVGNDRYVVDSAQDRLVETVAGVAGGYDTVFSSVSFSIADYANVEALFLTAGTGNTNATGNSLDNLILGNEGDNIIDGKAGTDAMAGGGGNDTYYVDNVGDFVFELGGNGVDTVISTIPMTSGFLNVENYVFNTSVSVNFTGDAGNNDITGGTGNDILDGNGGSHDVLRGRGGDDRLLGGTGDDRLDGGTGADQMTGGHGNDVYIVDSTLDVVNEAPGGGFADMVISNVSIALLWDNVEWVELTGTAALNITGNELANGLIGNNGSNAINGGVGTDALYGLLGDDTLTGGAGSDAFVFNYQPKGEGRDTITDFEFASDKLWFAGTSDNDHNGVIDINDLLPDVSSVVDQGAGRNVIVSFDNGGSITFEHAGTGSVSALTDLVASNAQVIVAP
jgi:Ca2+-binding RTX toxin-like protein